MRHAISFLFAFQSVQLCVFSVSKLDGETCQSERGVIGGCVLSKFLFKTKKKSNISEKRQDKKFILTMCCPQLTFRTFSLRCTYLIRYETPAGGKRNQQWRQPTVRKTMNEEGIRIKRKNGKTLMQARTTSDWTCRENGNKIRRINTQKKGKRIV